MSIHEVLYDSKGRVISARCVDEEIDNHRRNPQPDSSSVHYFHQSPVLNEIETTESGYGGLPAKFHTLTAVNKSTVIESFSELQFARSVKLAPSIVHRREDIANAKVKIRGHEYGFVWTEPGQTVDVYVAPTLVSRLGLGAKLRAVIGR